MSVEKRKGKRNLFLAAGIIVAVGLVFTVLPLGTRLFYKTFKIPAGSMRPTLEVGDYIFADMQYGGDKVARGDIIIFKWPPEPGKTFIKRVVGLPGETVEIKNRKVFINKAFLEEAYVIFRDAPEVIPQRDNFGPQAVPEDAFFVLGDNRDQSNDSRFWGYVPKENVVGKATRIYWSFDSEIVSIRWDRIGRSIQ